MLASIFDIICNWLYIYSSELHIYLILTLRSIFGWLFYPVTVTILDINTWFVVFGLCLLFGDFCWSIIWGFWGVDTWDETHIWGIVRIFTVLMLINYVSWFFDIIIYGLVEMAGLEFFYYMYVVFFVMYLFFGFFVFFYWGYLGTRGIFYTAEAILLSILIWTVIIFYFNVCYHTALTLVVGSLTISENLTFVLVVRFDLLSLLCSSVVIILTILVLTFGIEYMSREAFAYNVIATLIAFSSCIVWFTLSYSFSVMTFFWEFSSIFSLMLIDMYYCRIRTTQAVSRTYAISRFSDIWLLVIGAEFMALCDCDVLPVLFEILPWTIFDSSILFFYLFDSSSADVIIFSLFAAAACKCAQFILFVWLPSAMEAPTPASALIHSSTLVVMGIFMLLRFSQILYLSLEVLQIMVVIGAITVAYGAFFATQTSDLKKAVAYSTISQIGYMFCGCGLLAFKEVLLYLVMHAICKSLLFVIVGYLVHLFGGTTSIRRMGGIFFLVPDLALIMFILCMILAGAPYTVGFFIKELLVQRVFNSSGLFYSFVCCCWILAFFCTPVYLYRICILPIFGRPRCSRYTYRKIMSLTSNRQYFSLHRIKIHWTWEEKLPFFINQVRALKTNSRVTSILHVFFTIVLLFCGEMLVFVIFGLFNTQTLLLPNITPYDGSSYMLGLQLTSPYLTRNVGLLIVELFITVTLYFVFVNTRSNFNIIFHNIFIIMYVMFVLFILFIYPITLYFLC